MDFIDVLRQFSSRVEPMKSKIQTEEATKTSLIMPFFQQILGYDVFNPNEFVPEFSADVGIKRGEKVDYAIFVDGSPAILIEAKWCGEALDKHDSQLFRYFGTTTAKFGILTNGIIYKFYTDLEEQNKMDLKPFLEVDITNVKDGIVPELKKFHKSTFNVDEITSSASELKYSNEIRNYFASQLKYPSENFVRFILGNIYDGVKTQNVIERFTPIIKNALNSYISELMNERITTALKTDSAPSPDTPESKNEEPKEGASKIQTTMYELEAFFTIRAMLNTEVDCSKISYKDAETYFAILYDGNIRKWICRLKLDGVKKYLILPDQEKREVRYPIETISDLFEYRQALIDSVKKHV